MNDFEVETFVCLFFLFLSLDDLLDKRNKFQSYKHLNSCFVHAVCMNSSNGIRDGQLIDRYIDG